MGDYQKLPLPKFPYHLKIILVKPSIEGNLGAIARNMLNFGFNELHLVSPELTIGEEARKRAKHAKTVLEGIKTHTNLEEATKDCSLVIGTSGKREFGEKTITRHFLTPDEISERIYTNNGKIALVFGPEGQGLSQKELISCDLLTSIPTWEGYPIMNLSHSVSVILYELYKFHLLNKDEEDPSIITSSISIERNLDPKIRQLLRTQLKELEESLPWPESRKHSIAKTFVRTILRGNPTDLEVQQMLGVLIDSTTAIQYVNDNENWKRNRKRRVE
ncbi:MAG: rRNA methyltransferase [Euryarchaeota archaeon]|nr:rRNA methyltransferase [Euryarchaeota archaeon]|tara:strand:- start:340 stop:1164 length:825 start_codon:yes stop_codon:yes gene_type:complete